MVLSESCCFFVSPLRVHTRRAKASPDTYKHKLHSAHTHTHTHKDRFCASNWRWEVWRLAETGRRWEIKISSAERERGTQCLLFLPCPGVWLGKKPTSTLDTDYTQTHARTHTHTSLIISDKAHQLTRLIKLVMLNFDPVRTFKDTSM